MNARPESLPYRLAVGIVLMNASGHVWLGRRNDKHNAWQMPQGGIDDGETVLACARRELLEEVGTDAVELVAETADWLTYDYPPQLIPTVRGGRYRGQKQKWVLFRFTGQDEDIDLAAHDTVEFDAWRWTTMDEALAIIVPFKRPMYEAVAREFGPLLIPA